MQGTRTSKSDSGRWLPAESVVVVHHTLMNAQVVEDKRPVDYGAWQVIGHIARAANGELFVSVALIEPPHVVVLRSSDNGRTWSQPSTVWVNKRAQELNAGVRGLWVLRSGRLLTVIQVDQVNTYGAPNTLWCMYSDDAGRTWQVNPRPVDCSPFWTFSVPTNLFEDEDGHIVLPLEGLLEPAAGREWMKVPHAVGYLRSRDNGATWPERWLALRSGPGTGHVPGEHVTLPLDGGKWVMFIYMRGPDAMFRAVSFDRGRTWSRPQHVGPVNANHGALRLPDGGIMLHAMSCGGLQYKVSHDEGRTWAYEQPLDPPGDCAVSSVVLDERTVLVLHGTPTGPPHSPAYYYSGLRARFIRKR